MANDAELGKDLIVTSPTGDQFLLNRLRCDAASKILGVWLAPNGNHTKIVAELKEPAIEWGEKVRVGNYSYHEAW